MIDAKNNKRIARLIREADKAMKRFDDALSRLSAAVVTVPPPSLRRGDAE